MPEKHIYEYAVIRIVPKVEREEFINVGVILFSKQACFIKMRYDSFREYLEAFIKICAGCRTGGAIAQLEIPERFRWLTAHRSSCIQTSRPHVGYSGDLEETLERLFRELVL